jgi:sterol desaturase/sphingolipid hydroxylase (fatty acid hydroxylase superfamily)
MSRAWLLPFIAFLLLAAIERMRSAQRQSHYSVGDHALNWLGLIVQGALVPLAGYWIATQLLAVHFPQYAGTLQVGWWGAFALNFIGVDFLYYWQHRLFHGPAALWALHRCHHASPTVDVWTTARNSLAINLLFVYLPVNAVLGFLCDAPSGFFTAAAVTAALDVWRHSSVAGPAVLGRVLVTPQHHHWHHSPAAHDANFGANLIVWDRLFGTAREERTYPDRYGLPDGAPTWWRQFLLPW